MNKAHIITYKYSIKGKEHVGKLYYKDIDTHRSHNPFMAVKHHIEDTMSIEPDRVWNLTHMIE